MRDDHVAVGARLLVELPSGLQPEALRHVDLDVVDEVAVPDGLEKAVRESEREDVEGRLLAQEVVDAEDLLLIEHLVQHAVESHRTVEVDAERLLHDHPGALDHARLVEHAHGLLARPRGHSEVVQPAHVAVELRLRAFHGSRDRRSAGASRHVVELLREHLPGLLVQPARVELLQRPVRTLTELFEADVVEGHSNDPQAGDQPRSGEVEQARQQFPSREVPRRTEEQHDLGLIRTPARVHSGHRHIVAPQRRAWLRSREPAQTPRGAPMIKMPLTSPGPHSGRTTFGAEPVRETGSGSPSWITNDTA